ncbi:MAG: hypothetical protein KAH20_07200 [Methylococcales bacterium]|nr:hypothetical protein [Methylococcales bacterium]
MAEKTISKHLTHLDNQFSSSSPTLQKASKTYQELDQLEYNLGLIENNDTTARKSSWWPIVSLIGGFSTAKSEFINRYLGTTLHSSNHKSTVLQYTPQATVATLPGTALDADHRLPFYLISHKIEQIAAGEGSKVNAYLELKTVNSERLKGKLFIDTPVLSNSLEDIVQPALTQHILNNSDLILVFTDLFEATPILIKETIEEIVAQQDTNKFVFVIDHSEISIDTIKGNEIITSWQRRLSDLGIHTGQFILLSNNNSSLTEIDQRLANIENDRSYRVLNSLEQSIRDINDVYFPEVETYLSTWKDRVNTSTLIILGFIVVLLVFAEITMGVVQLLFDPIIGPAFILALIAFLVPLHLMMSKVHAKFIMSTLDKRQKKLNLNENLSGLFEKSLTFWRMILPNKEPVGKNKKTKIKIDNLIEQTKDIVQAQNDQFNHQQNAAHTQAAEISNSFENL